MYKLEFHNATQQPLDNFMIQFNKNSFALAPSSQNVPVAQVAPGSTQTAHLPLVQNPALLSPTAASAVLQVTWSVHFLFACRMYCLRVTGSKATYSKHLLTLFPTFSLGAVRKAIGIIRMHMCNDHLWLVPNKLSWHMFRTELPGSPLCLCSILDIYAAV